MSDTRERFDAICRLLSGCGADYAMSDETRLGADLQLDSLDLLDLTMRSEEQFRIKITDDEIDQPNTETFGGMLALIEGKLAHAG